MWRIPVHQKLMTSSALFLVCATLGWVHILPRGVQAKAEEDCVVCTSILLQMTVNKIVVINVQCWIL